MDEFEIEKDELFLGKVDLRDGPKNLMEIVRFKGIEDVKAMASSCGCMRIINQQNGEPWNEISIRWRPENIQGDQEVSLNFYSVESKSLGIAKLSAMVNVSPDFVTQTARFIKKHNHATACELVVSRKRHRAYRPLELDLDRTSWGGAKFVGVELKVADQSQFLTDTLIIALESDDSKQIKELQLAFLGDDRTYPVKSNVVAEQVVTGAIEELFFGIVKSGKPVKKQIEMRSKTLFPSFSLENDLEYLEIKKVEQTQERCVLELTFTGSHEGRFKILFTQDEIDSKFLLPIEVTVAAVVLDDSE